MTISENNEQFAPAVEFGKKSANVQGKVVFAVPDDLYIPPDALEVILETFEGPLDLLLYLIKKQNLDILDIPIAKITYQYQQYIELMQEINLELAADYLLMAALLAEIKSRLLLPRSTTTEEEGDPRAELIRRLKEYEQFKQAAENLDNLPRVARDFLTICVPVPAEAAQIKTLPSVSLEELTDAFRDILARAILRTPHLIQRETLSVRERMTQVLAKLQTADFIPFQRLFEIKEGRLGVVITLVAILELLKQASIEIVQAEAYGSIHVIKCQ